MRNIVTEIELEYYRSNARNNDKTLPSSTGKYFLVSNVLFLSLLIFLSLGGWVSSKNLSSILTIIAILVGFLTSIILYYFASHKKMMVQGEKPRVKEKIEVDSFNKLHNILYYNVAYAVLLTLCSVFSGAILLLLESEPIDIGSDFDFHVFSSFLLGICIYSTLKPLAIVGKIVIYVNAYIRGKF